MGVIHRPAAVGDFYTHNTAPMVYAHGFSDDILLNGRGLTIYTEEPIPDSVILAA